MGFYHYKDRERLKMQYSHVGKRSDRSEKNGRSNLAKLQRTRKLPGSVRKRDTRSGASASFFERFLKVGRGGKETG